MKYEVWESKERKRYHTWCRSGLLAGTAAEWAFWNAGNVETGVRSQKARERFYFLHLD